MQIIIKNIKIVNHFQTAKNLKIIYLELLLLNKYILMKISEFSNLHTLVLSKKSQMNSKFGKNQSNLSKKLTHTIKRKVMN